MYGIEYNKYICIECYQLTNAYYTLYYIMMITYTTPHYTIHTKSYIIVYYTLLYAHYVKYNILHTLLLYENALCNICCMLCE